ncbi:MAG: hypothetical protein F4X47_09100 [Gammaproteobacteria bacterium]|nr:hypothetical protein [Gammaproteobacteria bacterium]MYC52461.1 hypothetical protein [Gammaproteobacteria bacterium]
MFDAMEPIGLDTLKATRTLQAAGFDPAQAEALVTVFGGPVLANVATKEDFRDLRAEFRDFRTEIKADFEQLRTETKVEIDGLRTEFKADIAGVRAELKADIAGLRGEFVTKAQMYRLLLVQATVIVGLVVGLQQLLQP